MKTAKQFVEEHMKTSFNEDDLHMDCELTWDTIFSMMDIYGEYRQNNAPLPLSIQEALNSGDGTYRP